LAFVFLASIVGVKKWRHDSILGKQYGALLEVKKIAVKPFDGRAFRYSAPHYDFFAKNCRKKS
jgi:hypothetical protein